jgi:BolA protein
MSRNSRIHNALSKKLKLDILTIENESNRHHVPDGSETHFKIVAVSGDFLNLNRIERHRKINALLQEEFNMGLHALSLHLFTPDEWAKKNAIPASPNCRNGKRHG